MEALGTPRGDAGTSVKLVALHAGNPIAVDVERHGTGYLVKLDERTMIVDLVRIGPDVHSLRLEDGTQFSLVHHKSGNEHEVTLAGSKIRVEIIDPLTLKRQLREEEAGAAGEVKALMPGRIVRLLVEKGDAVRKGSGLLILEAMKMENEIQSPGDGVVDAIYVEAGQTVEGGAPLVHITSLRSG